MKRININKYIGTALLTLFLMGCSNILDETPRATFTPTYFTTSAGVIGGVTSMYGHLRYMFGNGYFLGANQAGTDESTWGQNSDANVWNIDFSGVGTISNTAQTGVLWGTAFANINTCNGVIQNAAAAGVSDAIVAEARFFRAFDYFLLVQTYGGVPLDLGSGELKFNTSTSRTSTRNTVPEVYTKVVFPDLVLAVSNLPDAGRVTGGVTKTAARLFLAKAYLTYAWWLENPSHIPSYPGAYTVGTETRTDPDGKTAAAYYQLAYDVATAAIAAPASFGLQSTFYDVNVGSNDRNNEILLYADHTQTSDTYNGGSLSYSTGGFSTDNFSSWFEQFNYTVITSSTSSTVWTAANSVQREAAQAYGRPWTMLAPPHGVFKTTFADKANDSRYDGTFVATYRANFKEAGLKVNGAVPTYLYNANFLPVADRDPIVSFLPRDTTGVDYSNTKYKCTIGAGVLPTRADFVIEPSAISRICYPGNWKLGPYRTDNGTGLGSPNGSSTRPFNIAKFSELFFIAAEAAVKGATTSAVSGSYANDGTARGLINVIRARAGKWKFNNSKNVTQVGDNSAAMIAATPATIDINYILAERSREYFGEGYRWLDLVRTQKLIELSSSFVICGNSTTKSNWLLHVPETFTRTILPGYYLRPIPSTQFDNMDMTAAEKTAYQNPAYQ